MVLLSNFLEKENSLTRIGAIIGLGIAYAGSQNEQLIFFLSVTRLVESSIFAKHFLWHLIYFVYQTERFAVLHFIIYYLTVWNTS